MQTVDLRKAFHVFLETVKRFNAVLRTFDRVSFIAKKRKIVSDLGGFLVGRADPAQLIEGFGEQIEEQL